MLCITFGVINFNISRAPRIMPCVAGVYINIRAIAMVLLKFNGNDGPLVLLHSIVLRARASMRTQRVSLGALVRIVVGLK